jgi:hypothetical protein
MVALRIVVREVARLLENGAVLTEKELFEMGSVAGTLRARLQYYRRNQAA